MAPLGRVIDSWEPPCSSIFSETGCCHNSQQEAEEDLTAIFKHRGGKGLSGYCQRVSGCCCRPGFKQLSAPPPQDPLSLRAKANRPVFHLPVSRPWGLWGSGKSTALGVRVMDFSRFRP